MSRARHKRARGGSTKPVWEAGGETNAAKEAEEKTEGEHLRRGGHVDGEGHKPKHRADKRARGGKVDGKEPHHEVKGHSMHHRHGMSIPGRKRGGGVGANRVPLSTASTVKHVTPGELSESGEPSD
jgi:hypothetical protein